ncbi:MAG: 23S rRNA (guanosine(2251)-2'-O)-methyltransferase RlmB [Acholeplasmataceae bacterium]
MIVYGKNVIREAIFAKRPFFALYLDLKFNDDSFIQFLKDYHIRYELVSKDELFNLSKTKNHQGIVANLKDYDYAPIEILKDQKEFQKVIILDSIEDPHNLGAILRTAEATQMSAIIIPKKQQVPLNATVAKVSSGAIEHVPVIEVTNINKAIEQLKSFGFWIVGTDGQTEHDYNDLPKNAHIAVILGNEGSGMRPLVKKNCDLLVKIPMYGKINSLNVSVAAALMMYKMIDE